jgi:hypothetical protein
VAGSSATHWRRGRTACSNNLLVPRELAEERVIEPFRSRMYTAVGIEPLGAAVNARLRLE